MKRKDLDLGKDDNKATNFWGCHILLSPIHPPHFPGADPELLEPPFMQELIHFHGKVCDKLEMSCFSL